MKKFARKISEANGTTGKASGNAASSAVSPSSVPASSASASAAAAPKQTMLSKLGRVAAPHLGRIGAGGGSSFDVEIRVERIFGLRGGCYSIRLSRNTKQIRASSASAATLECSGAYATACDAKFEMNSTLFRSSAHTASNSTTAAAGANSSGNGGVPLANEFDAKEYKLAVYQTKTLEGEKVDRCVGKVALNLAEFAGVPSRSSSKTVKLSERITAKVVVNTRFMGEKKAAGAPRRSKAGSSVSGKGDGASSGVLSEVGRMEELDDLDDLLDGDSAALQNQQNLDMNSRQRGFGTQAAPAQKQQQQTPSSRAPAAANRPTRLVSVRPSQQQQQQPSPSPSPSAATAAQSEMVSSPAPKFRRQLSTSSHGSSSSLTSGVGRRGGRIAVTPSTLNFSRSTTANADQPSPSPRGATAPGNSIKDLSFHRNAQPPPSSSSSQQKKHNVAASRGEGEPVSSRSAGGSLVGQVEVCVKVRKARGLKRNGTYQFKLVGESAVKSKDECLGEKFKAVLAADHSILFDLNEQVLRCCSGNGGAWWAAACTIYLGKLLVIRCASAVAGESDKTVGKARLELPPSQVPRDESIASLTSASPLPSPSSPPSLSSPPPQPPSCSRRAMKLKLSEKIELDVELVLTAVVPNEEQRRVQLIQQQKQQSAIAARSFSKMSSSGLSELGVAVSESESYKTETVFSDDVDVLGDIDALDDFLQVDDDGGGGGDGRNDDLGGLRKALEKAMKERDDALEEKAVLAVEVERKEERIAAVRREMDGVTMRLDSSEAALEEARKVMVIEKGVTDGERSRMEGHVNALGMKCDAQEAELKAMREKVKTMEEEREGRDVRESRAVGVGGGGEEESKRLREKEEELRVVKEERERQARAVDDMKLEMTELEVKLGRKEDEVEEEVEKRVRKVGEESEVRMRAVCGERDAAKDEAELMKITVSELEASVKAKEKEEEAVKEKQKEMEMEVERLKKDVETRTEQVVAARELAVTIGGESAKLNGMLAESEAARKEMERVREMSVTEKEKEMEEVRAELKETEEELEKVREELEDVKSSTAAEKAELEARAGETASQMQQEVRNASERAREESEKSEGLTRKVEQLEAQLQSEVASEREGRERAESEAKERGDALEKELEVMKEKVEKAEARVKEMEEEVRVVRASAEAMSGEMERVKEEKERVEKEMEEMRGENEAWRKERDEIVVKMEALEEQVKVEREEVVVREKEAREKMDEVSKELEESKVEVERLEGVVEEEKKKGVEVEAGRVAAVAAVAAMEKKHGEEEEKLSKAKAKGEEEVENMRKEASELENDVGRLKRELEATQSAMVALESKTKSMRSELEDASAENQKLMKSAEESEARMSEARAAAEDARAKAAERGKELEIVRRKQELLMAELSTAENKVVELEKKEQERKKAEQDEEDEEEEDLSHFESARGAGGVDEEVVKERDELASRVGALESELNEARARVEEIGMEKEAALQAAWMENKSMKEALEEEKSAKKESGESGEGVEKELELKNAEVEQMGEKLAAAEKAIQVSEQLAADMRSRLTLEQREAERERANFKAEVERLRAEVEELNGEQDEAMEQTRILRAKLVEQEKMAEENRALAEKNQERAVENRSSNNNAVSANGPGAGDGDCAQEDGKLETVRRGMTEQEERDLVSELAVTKLELALAQEELIKLKNSNNAAWHSTDDT